MSELHLEHWEVQAKTHTCSPNLVFMITKMIMYLISRRHFKAVDFFFPASLDMFSWRQNKTVFLLVSGTRRGEIKCPFHCTSFLSPAEKSTVTNALKIHLCKHNQHQRLGVFWFCHFYKFLLCIMSARKIQQGKKKTSEQAKVNIKQWYYFHFKIQKIASNTDVISFAHWKHEKRETSLFFFFFLKKGTKTSCNALPTECCSEL